MQGNWKVVVTRLHGKPEVRYTRLSGRAPSVGEILERPTDDGETVRARVGTFRHYRSLRGTSLGTWEIRADEIA